MQLQNNRKRFVIVGVVIVLVVVSIAMLIITRVQDGKKIDKPSGETISNLNNEAEQFGVENEIVYYGTSELLNAGMTEFSMESFRDQMQTYSEKNGNFIKTLSVYKESIATTETDENTTTKFKIQVNRKEDMDVSFVSVGLTDVSITVTDSSNKKVVDSGVLTYQDPSEEYTGDGAPPEEQ